RFEIAAASAKKPNIRLLIPSAPATAAKQQKAVAAAGDSPPGATARVSAATLPESSRTPVLAEYSVPSLSVDNAKPQQAYVLKTLPKFPAYALWMVRITGQARTVS